MSGTEQNRIALCDDHVIVRHALRTILQESPDNIVVAEAEDHESAIKLFDEHKVDTLILDLKLPGRSGMDTILEIRKGHPDVKILVFSMHDDRLNVEQAILSGADGYLVKDATAQEILEAVDATQSGGIFLQGKLSHLQDELQKKRQSKSADSLSWHPLAKLSKREREVFMMLADGQPNRFIAKKMFLSPRTVETHRARILKKLELNSTAELIRYAIKNNLVAL